MKTTHYVGMALVCLIGLGVARPAAAQRRPTIAIMPSQYYAADATSAANLTQGLVQQFEGQGYTVTPLDQARSTFQSMGLTHNQPYPDSTARRFGREAGADLVAYPRLLALGFPLTGTQGSALEPAAIVHLRVLNVHTGAVLFFRQIGHEFSVEAPGPGQNFELPQPVATAAAAEVLELYFRTVAGSARETRGAR